jgi:hypothetical protein
VAQCKSLQNSKTVSSNLTRCSKLEDGNSKFNAFDF